MIKIPREKLTRKDVIELLKEKTNICNKLRDTDLSVLLKSGLRLFKTDFVGTSLLSLILSSSSEFMKNFEKHNLMHIFKLLKDKEIICNELRDTDLSGLDLSCLDLSEFNFFESDLSSTCMKYTDCSWCIFSYADLSNSDLSYSKLICTNFGETTLNNTKIRYSNLEGANLFYTDISQADLTESNLKYTSKENYYTNNKLFME